MGKHIYKTCTICELPHYCKSYCRLHYNRLSRIGSPLLKQRIPNSCQVENCDRQYEGLGYCKIHYRRFRKFGDPLAGALQNQGESKTVEYKTWIAIRRRCRDVKYKDYMRYGAVGIKIDDAIYDSYQRFLSEVGRKPTNQHSIDREDNTRGYEVGNMRWATKHQQSANRRSTGEISGVNINDDGRRNKYHAELSVNGCRVLSKYFLTFEQAASARREALEEYRIVC